MAAFLLENRRKVSTLLATYVLAAKLSLLLFYHMRVVTEVFSRTWKVILYTLPFLGGLDGSIPSMETNPCLGKTAQEGELQYQLAHKYNISLGFSFTRFYFFKQVFFVMEEYQTTVTNDCLPRDLTNYLSACACVC